MGALLALSFGLPRFLRQQRERVWQKHEWRPLAGRSLLVVGTGAIGKEVAKRARALGLRTIGLNRTVAPLPDFDFSGMFVFETAPKQLFVDFMKKAADWVAGKAVEMLANKVKFDVASTKAAERFFVIGSPPVTPTVPAGKTGATDIF